MKDSHKQGQPKCHPSQGPNGKCRPGFCYYNKVRRQKRTAAEAKRNAIKRSAILPDTDFKKIEKIYKYRALISRITGIMHHVDHRIALAIGGAHHQGNLRVITMEENVKKGCQYDPADGGLWANNDLARSMKRELGIEQ